MTTLVGMTSGGVHVIAADGRSVANGIVTGSRQAKIIASPDGSIVVGVAGMLHIKQVVESVLVDPGVEINSPKAFADAVRASVAEDYNPTTEPGTKRFGVHLLYASNEGLWEIGQDFCIVKCSEEYPLVAGSGAELATGALAVYRELDAIPHAFGAYPDGTPYAVRAACEAVRVATRFDCYSGGGIMFAARGAGTIGPVWLDRMGSDPSIVTCPSAVLAGSLGAGA